MINFQSHDTPFRLKQKSKYKIWIKGEAERFNKRIDSLSYVFCSDEHLFEINQKYLNHDTLTDIITFDLSDTPDVLEAEIYISIARVKENAELFNVTFEEELNRVIIHGFLHLVGLNDKKPEEKEKMMRMENLCLANFANVPRGTFL